MNILNSLLANDKKYFLLLNFLFYIFIINLHKYFNILLTTSTAKKNLNLQRHSAFSIGLVE